MKNIIPTLICLLVVAVASLAQEKPLLMRQPAMVDVAMGQPDLFARADLLMAIGFSAGLGDPDRQRRL